MKFVKLDDGIRNILKRILEKRQSLKISDIKKLYKDLSFNLSLLQIRQITKPKANNPDYSNATTYKKDLNKASNHIQKAIGILKDLNFGESKNNTKITLKIQSDLNYGYQIDVLENVKNSISKNHIKSTKYNIQQQLNELKKDILRKMLIIFVDNNLQQFITTTQEENNYNEYPIFFSLYKKLCQINNLSINEKECSIFKQNVSNFKKGF